MNDMQLAAIREHISTYQMGLIDLGSLIKTIEILLNGLNMNPEWTAEARRNWGILEDIYSVALVMEEPLHTPAKDAAIQKALNEIVHLLNNVGR